VIKGEKGLRKYIKSPRTSSLHNREERSGPARPISGKKKTLSRRGGNRRIQNSIFGLRKNHISAGRGEDSLLYVAFQSERGKREKGGLLGGGFLVIEISRN